MRLILMILAISLLALAACKEDNLGLEPEPNRMVLEVDQAMDDIMPSADDASDCEDELIDQDNCFFDKAIIEDDSRYCKRIQDEGLRQSCYDRDR